MPQVVRFEPKPIDKEAERREIEQIVNGLAPYAIDEATGHAPENLINHKADQWAGEIERQYTTYVPRAFDVVARASAAAAQLRLLHQQDQRAVAELDVARRIAFEDLTGRPSPEPTATMDSAAGDGGVGDRGVGDRRVGDRGVDDRGVGATEQVAGQAVSEMADHRDPSLVAGWPLGAVLHLLTMLVAALADAGAFAQVVQLVMRNQPAAVAVLVVIGLTSCALYLAHTAGVAIRDRVARVQWGRSVVAWVSLACWLALGLLAAWVRLKFTSTQLPEPPGSLTVTDPAPAASAGQTGDAALPNALVFLALYLSTGMVAAIGGFLTHNPRRAAYQRVKRAYGRAYELAVASAAATVVAAEHEQAQQAARDRAPEDLAGARADCREFAEELKQYARVLIAQRAQDPAMTDALFEPDRRPYQHRPPDMPDDDSTGR